MRIDSCGASHVGNVRSHNEDNIYVRGIFKSEIAKDNILVRGNKVSGPYTFGVFDGLGGEACGEQASLIAALGLKTMEERRGAVDIDIYVSTAHKAILKEAKLKDAHNMGTTAVVVQAVSNQATIFNVGDSRAYLYRDRKLEQLSKDHSVIQSMIDGGFAEAAERHKEDCSGELTQYLGMPSEEDIEPEAYINKCDIQSGDVILLCSDGLTGELSDEEICNQIDREKTAGAEYVTTGLIKSAVEKNCKDNISVIVCIIE